MTAALAALVGVSGVLLIGLGLQTSAHQDELRSPAGQFTSVSVDYDYACGILSSRQATCWGDGSAAPSGEFSVVAVGNQRACGVRTAGELVCWPDGFSAPVDSPQPVAIAVSKGSVCVLDQSGTVTCWTGAVAPAGRGSGQFPESVTLQWLFKDIDAGAEALGFCGVERVEGGIICFSAFDGREVPAPLRGEGFLKVDVALLGRACALSRDGSITCEGVYRDGETPPPTGVFTDLSVGPHHACAIQTRGALICWGATGGGQADPPTGTFVRLSSGGWSNCAVRDDATIACWGTDPYPEFAGAGRTGAVFLIGGIVVFLIAGAVAWRLLRESGLPSRAPGADEQPTVY